MAKILLTGATGFLGGWILNSLHNQYAIACLKRTTSDTARFADINNSVYWIDTDVDGWKDRVEDFAPEIIIHSAWIGVEAAERNNWERQVDNISFLQELLSLAEVCGVKQFIGMGSQAEYGQFEGVIDENYPVLPNSAYAAAKVFCSALLKTFSARIGMRWYWLRLFSFFGEGEKESWLIPSTIESILNKKVLALTPGLQKYAYLYAGCLGDVCQKIIASGVYAGVYNISGSEAITIKELIQRIRDLVDPSYVLEFGGLPYREGQAMHIEGCMDKFNAHFGRLTCVSFEEALNKTVLYYKNLYNQRENESI